MDRGACRAIVWGVAKSQTQLSNFHFKDLYAGCSLAVQWLRLWATTAGGVGSIPGQGTKIPHAMGHLSSKRHIQMFSAAFLIMLEIILVSISWWMDKQKVASSNSGILSGNKKEQNTDTCYNMNAPQNMLNIRSQMQNTTYCMIPYIQNVQKSQTEIPRKQSSSCLQQGVGMVNLEWWWYVLKYS